MKEFTTNRFYKGINTDTSFLERQGDVLLDALNVRITNKNTNGLFAANIKGNVEEFELSPGFVPIGSVEYNGILFILSVNSVTNIGEIGTFPSPVGITPGGFIRQYSPLQNYTTENPTEQISNCTGLDIDSINRKPFTTEDLNFSCEHQARVLARMRYDKSINLYWTDNHNPIRSVNTGFHSETGIYNNTLIYEGDVKSGYINIVNENEYFPIVEIAALENFGSLKGGHYFFFVRYIDVEFNTTSFLGMSPPIPVFETQSTEDYSNGAVPTIDTPFGVESQAATNKNVKLNILNLDATQAFIEIGYAYYYGKDEYEIKLIDKRIPIQNSASLSNININGTESTIDLSLDEFTAFKPSDALYCKDIAQINNKLYLANTRGKSLDHPDLRTFFCKIKIDEDNSFTKSVVHTENSDSHNQIYGWDYEDVNQKVGYFSGEIYCFAVVPIFKDGFTGPAFPLTGYDNYKGTPINENYSGIYRFKEPYESHFYENDEVKIKAVRFDTSAAQATYNASTWLQENLIGIFFCRAERNINLQYQGFAAPIYRGGDYYTRPKNLFEEHSITATNWFGNDLSDTKIKKNWEVAMPSLERAAPYIFTVYTKVGISDEKARVGHQRYTVDRFTGKSTPAERDSLAIFSFDYHIDKGLSKEGVMESSYIKKIGSIEDTHWYPRAPASTTIPNPGTYGWDDGDYVSVRYPDQKTAKKTSHISRAKMFRQEDLQYNSNSHTKGGGFTANTHNLNGWDSEGTVVNGMQYPTKINHGTEENTGLFWIKKKRALSSKHEYVWSLPLAVPAYILVDLTTSAPDSKNINEWFNCIVNVYKNNPDASDFDYTSYYDFKNTLFSPISNFIPIRNIDDVKSIDNNLYYQGDCFTSRSYIKIHNKFNDALSNEIIDEIANAEQQTHIESNWGDALAADADTYNTLNELVLGGGYGQKVYNFPPWYYNNISYGYGLSVVTENAYNPNYRYIKGRNTFYPKSLNFLCPAYDITNTPESNFYNTGYQRMLNPRMFLGLDKLKPISDNSFPTRIRPSFTHILNSLRDGYLQFAPGGFKDFDFQYGPINAIMHMRDQLFSFQNDAINLHPINERAVAESDGTDTPFILGESKELTEYKRGLSTEYGTQHQWSIVKGERGIYGFDWNKQVFWRASGEGFQNLGLLKGCEKWIEDVVDLQNSGVSDITEQLGDNPVCNKGIHSVYDREHKEVITTFIYGKDEANTTISFSEKTDFFGAKYSFTPTFYSELEKDLYSFKDGKFWRHDANTKYDNFYGNPDVAYIEVVVNANGEIAKHFDNLIINSNNREFSNITYKTQHQTAEQLGFLGEFWNRAVYREAQWKLPIRRADSISDGDMSLAIVQSRMRGRYLIINLEYAGDKDMWVREIITAYTRSKA
jgi:hypothetical protein